MGPGRRPSSDKRLNTAGIGALSRRLMAVEKARALGRKPLDLRLYTLEKEAEAWAEKSGDKRR